MVSDGFFMDQELRTKLVCCCNEIKIDVASLLQLFFCSVERKLVWTIKFQQF